MLAILLSIVFSLVASAHAEETTRKVVHDSTEMTLTINGDDLSISYQEPPVQLREIGVQNGQVLVTGTWTRRDPSVLVGSAYMFKEKCEPIKYDIRGIVDQAGELVVVGPTPILKFESCDVATTVWSDDSVMGFAPPQAERKLKRTFREEAKPEPKPKPKPKPRRIERPAQPSYQQPYQYQWPYQWRY